jgi:hypothetical protein
VQCNRHTVFISRFAYTLPLNAFFSPDCVRPATPAKRTKSDAASMSALCHKQTSHILIGSPRRQSPAAGGAVPALRHPCHRPKSRLREERDSRTQAPRNLDHTCNEPRYRKVGPLRRVCA